MSNLRLLIVKYTRNISGSPICFSNELRYVEWNEYPFMYLPSIFQPNQLVELDPSIGLLRKLVYLNLKDCKNIISIPNIHWPCMLPRIFHGTPRSFHGSPRSNNVKNLSIEGSYKIALFWSS